MSIAIAIGLGVSFGTGLGVPAGSSAVAPIKLALQRQTGDINIIVCGDSLFNATDEAVYLFFAWLATQYPAVSFVYYPPDGSGGYGSPSTVQTGSGIRTIRMYNSSVAGTLSDYLMGSKFATAFAVTPDLVLWNYGKNHVVGQTQPIVEGEFMASIAQVQLAFPSAQHIVIDQYPNRDDANMAVAHASWTDIVTSDPAISLIDLYTPSYVAGDYTDNQHMNATANSTKLLPVFQAFWNNAVAGSWTAPVPWLSVTATNLLTGDSGTKFADFNEDSTVTPFVGANTSRPTGWNGTGGSITYTIETTIKRAGKTRSQKMVGSGSSPGMTYPMTAARLLLAKGSKCVLAVWKYITPGATDREARIFTVYNGTGGTTLSGRPSTAGQGGWRLTCFVFTIPADATSSTTTLFADSFTSAGVGPVYFQDAVMSVGGLPRSAA